MPVMLSVGLQVGVPGDHQRLASALGHPHSQQANRTQAVDVDHVRRVRNHLRQAIVKVLPHGEADLRARHRHAGESDLAPVGVSSVRIRPIRFRGDEEHLVARGEHLLLQELHRVEQATVGWTVVVSELSDREWPGWGRSRRVWDDGVPHLWTHLRGDPSVGMWSHPP